MALLRERNGEGERIGKETLMNLPRSEGDVRHETR